jgi:hypothetical protein
MRIGAKFVEGVTSISSNLLTEELTKQDVPPLFHNRSRKRAEAVFSEGGNISQNQTGKEILLLLQAVKLIHERAKACQALCHVGCDV